MRNAKQTTPLASLAARAALAAPSSPTKGIPVGLGADYGDARLDNQRPGALADFARGGAVRGPGTGTSDSIPARLSNGEYVLSADTVRFVGKDKLDALQAMAHKRVGTR